MVEHPASLRKRVNNVEASIQGAVYQHTACGNSGSRDVAYFMSRCHHLGLWLKQSIPHETLCSIETMNKSDIDLGEKISFQKLAMGIDSFHKLWVEEDGRK